MFLGLHKRSIQRALGVLSLAAAMLAISASSPTALQATQEETQAVVETALTIPDDLSAESLEAIDAELAKSLNPKLAILFDATQPADARKVAATELAEAAGKINGSTLPLETMKRHLLRRTALMQAALLAGEAGDLTASQDATADKLTEAVVAAETMLTAMTNGAGWVTYLHLAELKAGSADDAMKKQVLANLSPGDTLNSDQLLFLTRPALQKLKAALETSLAASSVSGDEAAVRAALNAQINVLLTSIFAWEKNALAKDAESTRTAWRSLRSRFPAASEVIRPVVNENYFNHNVHFTVSEDLLSRLISDYRTESGCIADCIMGAWVTGSQTTTVDVRADIRPSQNTAAFDLNVNGNTQSNTKAQKSPATVWTNGNHYFWMNRSVHFDGRHVNATGASFNVDTNSRTVGLATEYDGIPIIRGIVRKMAAQKIAESKPQSDALTASRLRDEALPKFQSETDKQFSTGNETLTKMLDSLERRGVAPDSISARSSNTHIAVSSRTIGVARLGGSVQPPAALVAKGAAAQIHQSALNNSIDALGFQGRAVPEKDFVTELEAALSDLFQREIKLTNGEPTPPAEGEEAEPPTIFLFSKTDPIRVRFDNGQIILSLRTGIRQEGKEEIPEETVTIPIAMSLQNGKVVIEPGNIAVTGRPTRSVQIKRVLARRIVRKELSPTVDLQAAGDKTLPVTITNIQLADGWLTAEME